MKLDDLSECPVGTLCTHSGIRFDVLHPTPEMVCLDDIAHSLASMHRFNGHTRVPYSVAQHSVLVSRELPDHLKLAGLLHDAAEAYTGDLIGPIKKMLPAFAEIEALVESAVFHHFGIPAEKAYHPEIKEADLTLLKREQRDLMPDCDWWTKATMLGVPKMIVWDFALSKSAFLNEFACIKEAQSWTF